MKCPHCGAEIQEGKTFCMSCGKNLVYNEEQSQFIADKAEKFEEKMEKGLKDSSIFKLIDTNIFTKLSSSQFRKSLEISVKICNVLSLILVVVCFVSALKYRVIYGWKWVAIGTIVGILANGILLEICGFSKFADENRIKEYDELVKNKGEEHARNVLGWKSSHVIRTAFIAIIMLLSFVLPQHFCEKYAEYIFYYPEAGLLEVLFEDVPAHGREFEVYMEIMAGNGTYETDSHLETDMADDTYKEIPEESQAVSKDANFQIGESVFTDLFEFTVDNAYVIDYLDENKKVPEGAVYVAIEYSYKNISKQPISSWALPSVRLADGNDAVYAQDADADWYFDGYSDEKMVSDLNPGIKTKGAKIFEVAIDVLNAGGMRAYVEADKYFYIDLPLSYDFVSNSSFGEALESDKAEGYLEDTFVLQKEDVLFVAYGNEETNVIMELGTYEDGTIGVIFHDNYNIIWQGELNRYDYPNEVGLWLNFTAIDGSYVDVEWSSYEAIDFPIVYSAPDGLGINGSYAFAYQIE